MLLLVREKLGRNADYHARMAKHYEDMHKPPEEAHAEGERPTRRRNGHSAPLKPGELTAEQAKGMAAMHAEVAKQLNDLLAADPPQVILRERAHPAVRRVVGAPAFERGGPVRAQAHIPTRH